MNPENVIEIQQLHKSFGRLRAVDGLSFCVPRGALFGFLGPNGSGKSTTLRVLAGLARRNSGRVLLFGKDVAAGVLTRDRVGMMIEGPAAYEYLSGRLNLRLVARLHPGRIPPGRIEDTLAQVNLLDRADDLVKNYSHGMKQRLGLALALLHRPELLILDEPTNGLDPEGNAELWSILRRLAGESGATVLVSSHLLHEIEQNCTHVAVIRRGRLVAQGRVRELLRVEHRTITVGFAAADDRDRALALLRRTDWIDSVEPDFAADSPQLRVHPGGQPLERLTRLFQDQRILTTTVVPSPYTLHDLFMKLTKEE